MAAGVLTTPAGDPVPRRLAALRSELVDLMEDLEPGTVVVERAGPSVRVLSSVEVAGREGGPFPVVCVDGQVVVASFHPELAGDGRLHELLLSRIEGD